MTLHREADLKSSIDGTYNQFDFDSIEVLNNFHSIVPSTDPSSSF